MDRNTTLWWRVLLISCERLLLLPFRTMIQGADGGLYEFLWCHFTTACWGLFHRWYFGDCFEPWSWLLTPAFLDFNYLWKSISKRPLTMVLWGLFQTMILVVDVLFVDIFFIYLWKSISKWFFGDVVFWWSDHYIKSVVSSVKDFIVKILAESGVGV